MTVSQACMDKAKYDTDFKNRVEFFMKKAAIAILGEVAPTGDEHTSRADFANRVLAGSARVVNYAVGVSAHNTVSPVIDSGVEVTDSVMESAVNSLFSKYSGWDQ